MTMNHKARRQDFGKYMHPYTMKGFTGTISPYPYFNAKTDAEAIEAALMLRRGVLSVISFLSLGSITSKLKQLFGIEMPGENASLPAKWFAALIKALRPTVENNKSGYCWPYCDGSDDQEEKEKFEKTIIEILTNRSNVQRQQICITYMKIYQKDMLEELKSCLNGDFQDAVEALVTDPVLYDVQLLHRALFELLTIDGELLAEIICSRTNVQLMAIQEKYAEVYGDVTDKADNGRPLSLVKDIEKIFMESRLMSDRENAVEFVKKVFEDAYHREWSPKMSPADRDEQSQWDERLARSDAGELYGAGEFKWGTDEGGFINVLFQQNVTFAQLRATFDAYERLYNRKIVDVANEEFSGVLKELISTYIECIISRQEFFANQMYEAMRGLGTDDDRLIRNIVARCEVDMVQIKLCYKDLFKKTCKEAIDDDTSGTYGDLLLALVGPGP
ncbi:annexin A13-like isoform X4 [Bolinopsis microptera]|uniref:annexin A13-like isoform X4 n=1 Tax=Bolinopsis microptera TaxID=2820187 RepID=UPI00307AAF98